MDLELTEPMLWTQILWCRSSASGNKGSKGTGGITAGGPGWLPGALRRGWGERIGPHWCSLEVRVTGTRRALLSTWNLKKWPPPAQAILMPTPSQSQHLFDQDILRSRLSKGGIWANTGTDQAEEVQPSSPIWGWSQTRWSPVSFPRDPRGAPRPDGLVARHIAGVQQIVMRGKKRQEEGRDRRNA